MPTSLDVFLSELLSKQLAFADQLINISKEEPSLERDSHKVKAPQPEEVGKNHFNLSLQHQITAKWWRKWSDGSDILVTAPVLGADLMSAGIALGKGSEEVLKQVGLIIFPIALIGMVIGGALGVKSARSRKREIAKLDSAKKPSDEAESHPEAEKIFLLYTLAQNFTNLAKKDGSELSSADKAVLQDNFDTRLRKLLLDDSDTAAYLKAEKVNQNMREFFYGWLQIGVGAGGLGAMLGVALAIFLNPSFTFTLLLATQWMIPVVSFVAAASFLYTAVMFWYKYTQACIRLEKVKQFEQPKIDEINKRIASLENQINTYKGFTDKDATQTARLNNLIFICNELKIQRNICQTKIDCLQRHPDLRLNKGIAYTTAGLLMLAAAACSLAFALNPVGLAVLATVATALVVGGVVVLTAYLIHNMRRESSLKNAQQKLNEVELTPIAENFEKSSSATDIRKTSTVEKIPKTTCTVREVMHNLIGKSLVPPPASTVPATPR